MSDAITKLRILYRLSKEALADIWSFWKSDIWDRDLDCQYCCDGRECGCGG